MVGHRSLTLRNVCTVQIGYTARKRIRRAARDGILAVQLRDVPPNGSVDPAGLERLKVGTVPDRYMVGAGDVLFRSRGESNTACALDVRFREHILAMLPLFILRPKQQVVMPEFLAWAINRPRAQRHFDRYARGTNMRMIPRAVLTGLEIAIPALAVQRRIVALDILARRERTLTIRAAEKKRSLVTRILGDLTTEPNPSRVWSSSLCDNLRLTFGVSNPTPTTPRGRVPDGPADID